MNTNTNTKRNAAVTAEILPTYRTAVQAPDAWDGCDGGWIELKFANGKELQLSTNSLSNGLLYRAAMHGLKQKLVDAAAMSRNPETGRSATIEDKFAAVQAVYERLLAGQWNAVRGEGSATGGMLLSALVRLYDGRKTPEQVRGYLTTLTDAQKTALRANSRVAPIIEQIRAERGQATDTEALLDMLDGMGDKEDGE